MSDKQNSFNRGWNEAIQGLSRAENPSVYIAKVKNHLATLKLTTWHNGVLAAFKAYQAHEKLENKQLVA